MSRYLDLFVSEARQHVQDAEREITRMAEGAADTEGLNALFRHFHSLKGMAASMGFQEIARLSHAIEDLFDEIRKEPEKPPHPGVTDLVVEGLDVISDFIEKASAGEKDFPAREDLIAKVKQAASEYGKTPSLTPREGDRRSVESEKAPSGRMDEAPDPPPSSRAPAARATAYRCRLHINPEADLPAARAALALRHIESLGVILTTTPPRETLGKSPFDGVLTVLLSSGLSRERLTSGLEGLLDVASYSVSEEILPTDEVKREGGVREAEQGLPSTIRIPTASLDHFLDTLGELITWRGSLSASLKSNDLKNAAESHDRLSRAIDRLRNEVMSIRLLPFDHIVPHLNQTVRTLARQTGKRVAIQISGTEVALDRAVLEEILDPLNHILRNAVDHGIELADDRLAAGKEATGRVFIAVSRAGDRVRIRIEDDGAGMDTDAIARTAVDGGFLSAEEASSLRPQELLMLTTIPGFSTSLTTTELSGRGVGMDVVRTRIEKLGGHIDLQSIRGAGVTVLLDLPLTVAVIDAFLVEAGGSVFAVPASVASRTILASRASVRRSRTGFYLEDAGALLHAFRPDEALGLRPASGELPPRFPVILFRTESSTGALAVDAIIERRELVVKPLGSPLDHLREYSGAALLDDGRIALILDVANLHRQVVQP